MITDEVRGWWIIRFIRSSTAPPGGRATRRYCCVAWCSKTKHMFKYRRGIFFPLCFAFSSIIILNCFSQKAETDRVGDTSSLIFGDLMSNFSWSVSYLLGSHYHMVVGSISIFAISLSDLSPVLV